MPDFFASHALLPGGWARDVLLRASDAGDILSVSAGATPGAARRLSVVIPGVPNLHSHAFQRAIAGVTERRSPPGAEDDSFWTWREQMYRLCARFSPEDAEAVAAQLYAEMLEQGFTSVCEFHYLHHDPDGAPYADRAEMAHRHVAAARRAGIGMTLLPCLYAQGGAGGVPPTPGQRRFLNSVEQLLAIHAAITPDAQLALGLAPHSLRAVTPAQLRELLAAARPGPIHIHAAEQPREVAETLAAHGARPVEWLLANAPLDARWCIIHATHMTDSESAALARTGAVAGLCPSTEANLGDGVFGLPRWLEAGGALGIGTDSHVGIAPAAELRQLETSQRLATGRRAVATREAAPHPGRLLLEAAVAGGAQASGRRIGAIEAGHRCDLVELDPEHPALIGREGDSLLDSWIFAGNGNPVRSVICGGRTVVEAGRHVAATAIAQNFRAAMRRLAAA
jgi:formimidoylglutamate deiminase